MDSKFKKAVIFYNDEKPGAESFSKELAALIKTFGSQAEPVKASNHEKWTHNCDLVIAVGGDGTVLHAARDLADFDIPVLGINMGRLGFLSVMDASESSSKLYHIFNGSYRVEHRLMLQASVFRGEQKLYDTSMAFNDCVLKPEELRSAKINVTFSDKYTQGYFGDGLIISTPTGSTAYALSCFGPVIYPSMDSLLVVAISPHVLTQRPLVLPGDFVIKINCEKTHNLKGYILSVDGQENYTVTHNETVVISKSEKKVQLILPQDYQYFNVLNKKLKWGER